MSFSVEWSERNPRAIEAAKVGYVYPKTGRLYIAIFSTLNLVLFLPTPETNDGRSSSTRHTSEARPRAVFSILKPRIRSTFHAVWFLLRPSQMSTSGRTRQLQWPEPSSWNRHDKLLYHICITHFRMLSEIEIHVSRFVERYEVISRSLLIIAMLPCQGTSATFAYVMPSPLFMG